MAGTVSPTESHMAAIASAREFLTAKGFRVKAVSQVGTPLFYYQVTSYPAMQSADQLLDIARRFGWKAEGHAVRRIVGKQSSQPVPINKLGQLARRVMDHARANGCSIASFSHSDHPDSPSRYITIRDVGGHEWLMRISDHKRPRFRGRITPHFDLISRDGDTGFDDAAHWIDQIASGQIAWQPPLRERIAHKQKRRPTKRKHHG